MNLPDVNPLNTLLNAQSGGFSGSYAPDQVQLLLRLITAEHTDVEEKERLIQTGQKHYSEMISLESAPSELHQQVYQQAVAEGLPRLAREIQALALALQQHVQQQAQNTLTDRPLVLVSLVRAGLPIGVMLQHALKDLGVNVLHYGVSIIRDRGLDAVAYAQIRQQHAYAQLVFVDGWTGKGAISRELRTSVQTDPEFDGVVRLVTLADVSGYAWLTASSDDWLIPSGVLGATVSGLISRTLYQADQLHGCLFYNDLHAYDHSRELIEQVNQQRQKQRQQRDTVVPAVWPEPARQLQQQLAASVIAMVAERFDVQQPNRIKPSLAEATRAVLRRVPERVLLREADDPQTRLLRHLAAAQGAPIELLGDAIAPYRAITIIQRRGA